MNSWSISYRYWCLLAVLSAGCAMPMEEVEADDEPEEELVGRAAQELKGEDVYTAYREGVVKIKFRDHGFCSGVMIGHGLIMTAAHCVAKLGVSNGGLWDMRIYYKKGPFEDWTCPGSSLKSDGNCKYGTHRVHWDPAFDPSKVVDDFSDMAIIESELTSCRGGRTGRCWHDVDTDDFVRIYDDSLSANRTMYIYGYGYLDNAATEPNDPRRGYAHVDEWSRYQIIDEAGGTRLCHGDSGGPWIIERGKGYIAGVSASTQMNDGRECAYNGAEMRACRAGAKMWLVEQVKGSRCLEQTDDVAHYYRCW